MPEYEDGLLIVYVIPSAKTTGSDHYEETHNYVLSHSRGLSQAGIKFFKRQRAKKHRCGEDDIKITNFIKLVKHSRESE